MLDICPQKNFPEFQKLIKTMNESGFDYRKDYQIVVDHVNKRASGKIYSLSEHISAMVFSQLSNQRPWEGIAKNAENINYILIFFQNLLQFQFIYDIIPISVVQRRVSSAVN